MAALAKYDKVAIGLHWAVALLIIINLILGHVLEGMGLPQRIPYIVSHIWIGLAVLALSVFRLGWRLTHPKPPYPAGVASWEQHLATATQVFFYILMIGLPVVGFLILSANPPNPKMALNLFGIIPIPFFEPLQMMEPKAQKVMHDDLVNLHALGGWLMVAALALHLLGIAKHLLFDRTNVLTRMLPGGATSADPRESGF